MQTFTHHGLFSPSTRLILPLQYLEDYISEVTSDFTLPYPNTKYYTPSAVFHDNGVLSHGADEIKDMMRRVFGQFSKIEMQPRYLKVLDESKVGGDGKGKKGKWTVVAELMVGYYLNGGDEPVWAPRLMVFEIVKVDVGNENKEANGVAYLGLNFQEVWLGWNVGAVKEEVLRRKQLEGET